MTAATFDTEILSSAFAMASSVAPARSVKEVLMYAKLNIKDGEAILSATDLEDGLSAGVACEIKREGSLLLPVQRVSSILRQCQCETVDITSNDESAVLQGKGFKFVLPTPNPDEFPSVSFDIDKVSFTMPCSKFIESLQRTMFCVDESSARFALGGIKFEKGDTGVVFVATDGRRCSVVSHQDVDASGFDNADSQILPGKSAKAAVRIFSKCKGDVHVSCGTHAIQMLCDGISLTCPVLEGRYANWKQVFPNYDTVPAEASVGVLSNGIMKSSIVACDENRGVSFKFSENLVRLENSTADVGASDVEIDINYQGDAFEALLDHRFVADFLRVHPGDEVCNVQFSEGTGPVVCSVGNHKYVVMPMSKG
jgi:DNA polymerase-3 subunit beta